MSLNSKDRNEVVKHAKANDYRMSSDGSKLINGNGGNVKFSDNGKSVHINGSYYDASSDTGKSTKW